MALDDWVARVRARVTDAETRVEQLGTRRDKNRDVFEARIANEESTAATLQALIESVLIMKIGDVVVEIGSRSHRTL